MRGRGPVLRLQPASRSDGSERVGAKRMADTGLIKKLLEPYLRRWLSKRYRGRTFAEQKVQLITGGFHRFDAVSADGTIVADFLSSRPSTGTGNENTGAVRKAKNDLQFLSLLPGSVKTRLFVFTDRGFLELMRKRAERVSAGHVEFLYCELPKPLRTTIEKVLDACRREQRMGRHPRRQKPAATGHARG